MPAKEMAVPANRRLPLLWTALAIGAGIGVVVLFVIDPARMAIFPPCPFHEMTGFDCPGCGSTRALHQLLHGHVMAALHYNAMLVLSLPLAAGIGLRAWLRRGTPQTTPLIRLSWLWIFLGAWVVFAVLRDLPIPWFSSFAP